jgi:hypothetical protein
MDGAPSGQYLWAGSIVVSSSDGGFCGIWGTTLVEPPTPQNECGFVEISLLLSTSAPIHFRIFCENGQNPCEIQVCGLSRNSLTGKAASRGEDPQKLEP